MRPTDPALPAELVTSLRGIRSAGVITGAGISRESGIPTYRGSGGIYDDPAEGERTVEALSARTLASDPDRTWRAVARLARQSAGAAPNPAHHALVEIEQKLERFVLLTQNVDGLHQRAGSDNVIAIHGDVLETRCMKCGKQGRIAQESLPSIDRTPDCDRCPGALRPAAVLFGELLPVNEVARMQDEFYRRAPDLVIVAGTTAMFPYISEPVIHARRSGKLTIEINPEPTDLSDEVDFMLRGPAGLYLPAIARALIEGR